MIKKIGTSRRLGRYIVLQDVYGNRYTYARLGSVARFYPVPKEDAQASRVVKAVKANADPKPAAPAASRRADPDDSDKDRNKPAHREESPQASVPVKERLFANPNMSGARENGGLEQVLDSRARRGDGFTSFKNYFSRPFGMNSRDVRLRRLKVGSRVIGGTILGRIGKTDARKAPHLYFEIRPAGRGARIDPKPILDGWKLLEATAIYRANGRNALYGDDAGGLSIGQIMLLPKPLLEKRVLNDPRVEIYDGGRQDIRSGQIDRRVLATLEYLAEAGLKPTVTSLKAGHSTYTTSGNVSHHSSGNAVDIAKINGVPIIGHQERGGITEQSVRMLMRLQGTMHPTRSSRCSTSARTRSRWATTTTTSTSASGRCSAPTRSSASRRSPCSNPGSGPICSTGCAGSTTRSSRHGRPGTRFRSGNGRHAVAARTGASSATADFFGFVQLEFGFLLGAPDGRYLVRDEPGEQARRFSCCTRSGRRSGPASGSGRGAWSRRPTPSRCPPHAPR